MKNEVTFASMIDLALASPEIGAVNFNVLQQFLHELIKRLNFGGEKVVLFADEKELQKAGTGAAGHPGGDAIAGGDKRSLSAGVLPPNYGTLLKRVETMENKLNQFDSSYPGAEELLAAKRSRTGAAAGDSGTAGTAGSGSGSGGVSDMWKFIQLQKRCDANETGMGKITELVESLMDKIAKLEDDKDKLMERLSEFKNQPPPLPVVAFPENQVVLPPPTPIRQISETIKPAPPTPVPAPVPVPAPTPPISSVEPPPLVVTETPTPPAHGSVDKNKAFSKEDRESLAANLPSPDQLAKIEERLRNLEKTSGKYATQDDLNSIRQQSQQAWQAVQQRMQQQSEQLTKLENDLRALLDRDGERDEMNAQTLSKLDAYSQAIARLTERSNEMEKRISTMQEELLRKADRSELSNMHVSDSLLASIDVLRQQLENLTSLRERDADLVRQLRDSLDDARDEVERLRKISTSLVTDVAAHTNSITTLTADSARLQEDKADRLWVAEELMRKSDRPELDRKANASEVQQLIKDLNRLIEELQQRAELLEEETKRARMRLDGEFARKADRSDLETLRDYLESKLKSITSKLGKLGAQHITTDNQPEEAAAFKVVRSHCLSCDRPIELRPFSPPPSIPGPGSGIPATRTPRPFTTYELEQIRQATKSKFGGDYRAWMSFQRAMAHNNVEHMEAEELKRFVSSYQKTLANLSPERGGGGGGGGKLRKGTLNDPIRSTAPAEQPSANMDHQRSSNLPSVIPPPQSSRTGFSPAEIEGIAAQNVTEQPYLGMPARPVGGSHTMTYPHHRVTRITHLSAVVPEDVLLYDLAQDERDIQGADGRMYRARYSERLPAVNSRQVPGVSQTTMRAYGSVNTSQRGGMTTTIQASVDSTTILRQIPQRDINNGSQNPRPGSARTPSAGAGGSRRRPVSASGSQLQQQLQQQQLEQQILQQQLLQQQQQQPILQQQHQPSTPPQRDVDDRLSSTDAGNADIAIESAGGSPDEMSQKISVQMADMTSSGGVAQSPGRPPSPADYSNDVSGVEAESNLATYPTTINDQSQGVTDESAPMVQDEDEYP